MRRAAVITDYDADGRPIAADLDEGEILEGAVTSTSVTLYFTRWLLPHEIVRQSLCIHATTDTVTGIGDCPGQPFTEPAYDPVSRSVTYRLPIGDRLAADTLYRISVFRAASTDESGFFAFDGAPLDRGYAFDFRTQPSHDSAQDELRPLLDRPLDDNPYCIAQRCFAACMGDDTCEAACRPRCVEPSCFNDGDYVGGAPAAVFQSCAFVNCHGPDTLNPDKATDFLPMGLDLSSPSGLEATAIDLTAHQTQAGQTATAADRTPLRFGRAMPLIDPGNPGNSYVLYKILANPLNHLRPGGALDADLAAEIDRLRDGVVVGLPMPAQSAKGGPQSMAGGVDDDPEGRSAYERARILSTWIAYGAVTACD